jgi:protein-tyrosine kinase
MSRIDQALKILEGATSAETSEAGAIQTGSSSPLNQYSHEGSNQNAREETSSHPPPEAPPPTESPAPSVRRNTRRGPPVPRASNADLQARLVTGAPNNVALEQYRKIAAVLHEEQVHKHLKTVMITSAVPQEGKTLTLVNLALTLSESYARRVLVIDADLRWPSLHTVLNIPNRRGLSEALREGRHELPFTEVSSHLTALTAGRPGPTPLAGLASPRMGEVIDECAGLFDWVLMDTPPVGVLPDAHVLTRLVGGVIFVIGAGSTPAATVEQAIADLGTESIIGTVLNRVEERRIAEAGYYGQYGTSSDGR